MKKSKIIIVCSLLLMFIVNTIVVVNNGYGVIDGAVYNFVMRYASEMTTRSMHVITFFGSTKFIVGLCVIIFFVLLFKKKKMNAFSTAALLIISTVTNTVIKLTVQRARPEYITVIEHSYSYPSGHTMASCTLYGFMIYLLLKSNISKKYKILYSGVLGLLIFLVGLSRIYLGAHFFSDVFGGILLSTSLLLIFDLINEKKKLL